MKHLSVLALGWLCLLLIRPVFAHDTVYYIHTDALHSEVVVTDAGHNVVERTYYAPYGQVLNRALRDGPGYTGHEEDPATGFSYMDQRYYDPQVGGFLSSDPIDISTTDGSNFNRYWYANDNPYRYTDPDGRQVGEVPVVVAACAASPPCAAAVVTGAAALGVAAKKAGDSAAKYYDHVMQSKQSKAHDGSSQAEKPKSAQGDRNPADDQRLSGGEVKKLDDAGHDVHELKGGKNASKQDLFKDKKGNVYVKPKSGKGPGEPTGINLKDLQKPKPPKLEH